MKVGGQGDVTQSMSHNLASIDDIPCPFAIMDTTSIETLRPRLPIGHPYEAQSQSKWHSIMVKIAFNLVCLLLWHKVQT